MEAKLRHTKFIVTMLGLIGLFAVTFANKFSGELGLAIGGIVATYVTGNAFITGRALANGKDHDEPA